MLKKKKKSCGYMGEKVRHWIEGELRSLDLYGSVLDQEK